MKSIEPIRIILLIACASLVSCASGGRKFTEMRADIPALDHAQGRIYIYRTSTLGAAVQPEVHLNEEVVSKATPKGFTFVDRPAGNYQIKTTTEVKRSLSLVLEEGQTRFVRLGISMGFLVGHVYPELVDAATGETDLRKCRYIGRDPLFREP